MAATVWLVSSREWPDAGYAVSIDAAPQVVTASLGGLYLVHPTSALSLLVQLLAAMTTAGVVAPAAFITEQRYVRLTSSGVFAVTWTSTVLRDLLGFTGNLAAASAYTATGRSPLLWSPGKTETPGNAILGSHGQKTLDMSVAFGEGGRQTVRQEGPGTVKNRFSWAHVPLARYLTTPATPVPGEWVSFWETELVGNNRLALLRGVTEGSSTTVSAGYGSATALGPYKADLSEPEMHRTPFARSAGFERVDAYQDCTVPVVQTPEFA